ncbi:TetR/AcrR family transcriptional regulator [Providencia sp.]|uniref:TetR/AcrR family transcriptional regulator n=1 Tax=Providencia sp. TaxID=589 RepID=UPI0025DD718D|nr:TetR/AcrR family transcriptional regulator [Providencia sp.]
MKTRVPESPIVMRRAPSQNRSRMMVSVILESATRVLAETGWSKFTTNQVASIAGVSIGSLYQYYPNKLALAEAIRQQHLEDILQVLDACNRQKPNVTNELQLTDRVEGLIDGIVAVHLINPNLHRILLEEVPLSERNVHQNFELLYANHYLNFTTQILGEDSPRNKVVSKILASTIEGVMHNAARHGELKSSEIKQELMLLICSYLKN